MSISPEYKRNPKQPINTDASAIKFEDTRFGFGHLVLDPKLTA